MSAEEMFDRHEAEHCKFDRIRADSRRHPMRDLCAMLYLCERFGTDHYKAIGHAEHDEIWLAWDAELLTEADVIYLLRCGVRYSQESLAMFV